MKNMSMLRLIVCSSLMLFLVFSAAASRAERHYRPGYAAGAAATECPEVVQDEINSELGPTASALTECLAVQHRVAAVVNWNRSIVNKGGVSQQGISTLNLAENYEMYGMTAGAQYLVAVIAYGQGGRWLLNDEAYNQSFGVTTGNPTRQIVEDLLARNLDLYMCQNTMKGNGWQVSDLLPGVKMVPSGAAAVVDFQLRGYRYLNP